MKNYLISLMIVFTLSACATLPPLQEMSNARQTIAAAKEMNSTAEQSQKIQEAERLLSRAERRMEVNLYESARQDALRAQIFGCWSVPLGLPYDEDLLVRIKLKLKKDGTIMKSEILDHQRMNRPGQKFYKVLTESALRAVRLCQPLKVPPTGDDKWKELQLNFNPTEMLKG